MANTIRIILTFSTWENLEETLLQVLPEGTPVEVIVMPSSPQLPSGESLFKEKNLHQKLKSIQSRMAAHYPHVVFNFENIIERNEGGELSLKLPLLDIMNPGSLTA